MISDLCLKSERFRADALVMSLRPLALAFSSGCIATLLCIGAGLALRAKIARPQSFGHYAYAVANPANLVEVGVKDGGKVLLKPSAALAFAKMQDAARAQGVNLVPVSGFRDAAKQSELFFDGAAQKNEPLAARAAVCAPPGFSEHHTGYSLDVGDGDHRESQLEATFKDTRAFSWLRANAARYHFEMSFPEGNPQGVAYEPWHWRFVGNLAAFKTFFTVLPARLEVP